VGIVGVGDLSGMVVFFSVGLLVKRAGMSSRDNCLR